MKAESEVPPASNDWRTLHASMVVDAEEAIARIKPGSRVFIGTGCGEPVALVRALAARADDLADVEIVHLLTFGDAPYTSKKAAPSFRVNSFFIADNVRSVIQKGVGDYTPIFLSEIPRLFKSGEVPLDVALIQVTPPDERGMCSLGVSVDVVKGAAENASLVIAQVNPNMPRTHGQCTLHVHDFDCLVPSDEPIIELPPIKVTEETRKIAGFIAPLIDDGATLEFGIGEIPQALMGFLQDKKDLGIHTEMITDGIIDLIESGIVTGSRKSMDRGKVVSSFCLGTRRLYDYIDNNPVFSFQPTEYVNDPFVISRQHKMVAINVALEIDLTGQVCADSLGSKFYSGIGGQVDFNRGAARSEGGKAIIAMPSTAKNGTVSRIVSCLTRGAGVVTTRGDVHYVATEYGVAYLHGESIHDRAIALISIAHPKFRARLLKDAIKAKFISSDLLGKGGMFETGPDTLTSTYLTRDGTAISFRSVQPTDEPRMRHLFYALSRESIYLRFMSFMKQLPRDQLDDSVFIDHRNEVVMVGTVPAPQDEEIIAVGAYYLNPKTNRAEVAFTVQDNWHKKGIATFMFNKLAEVAKRSGIKGFTAETLTENTGMQRVFMRSPFKTRTTSADGVYSFTFDF